SALGVVGGYGLGHALAAVSDRIPGIAALEPPTLHWWIVAVGMLLGLVVTLVSVWMPARKAMRTSPLMAMRPLEAVRPEPRARARTAVIGGLLLAVGIAGMVAAVLAHQLLLAIPSAAVTVIGMVVVLRLLAAPMIAGLAGLVPGGWLAFRRTAPTTIGMVIDVCIVSTMMVRAVLAQRSISAAMVTLRPVYMFVTGEE